MSDVSFQKIRSIKRVPAEPVYDIQVKKNHNFFANSLVTHNCLIFQEDVMQLAETVGGFPKDQCDNVRRAIMKRDLSKGDAAIKEAKKLEDDYVKGAMEKGVPEATARKSYETILWFAGYGFNRCLYFSEEVNTYSSNGELKEIKRVCDVVSGDIVKSRNETDGKDVFVNVAQRHDNGCMELVELELTTGEKVRCTWDHKFRTVETGEMLPLKQIHERGLSIVVQSVRNLLAGKSGFKITKPRVKVGLTQNRTLS